MIEFDVSKIRQIESIINNSNNVLLISHKGPDGDTLWSTLAFNEVLTARGKVCTTVCVDAIPENLQFLPGAKIFKKDFIITDYDVVIISDIANQFLTWLDESHPELFNWSTGIPVINIDHHVSNELFWTVNLVVDAASSTVIITELFMKWWWNITSSIATCLLCGIYTDTGSFMHSNTDAYTMRVASKLVSKGANLRKIRKNIFKTTKLSTLKLWGRVLKNIYKNEQGVTVSVVTEDDFKETKSHYSELSGVVDYVNSVPNSDFSILLTERDGKVKGSLRTLNENVDLNKIAENFWWWGHKKAAGFAVPGKLQREVRWTVIND